MLERASRSHLVIGLISVTFLLGAFLAFIRTTEAVEPGTPQFQRTWERTDKPVKDGQVSRTWMWGPEAFTGVMSEPYVESPGGARQVQYFDKSRMEINFPDAPDDGLWYVTNGLLVVEMISGEMQVGENSFETRGTSLVNVAGDPNDANAPTYSSFISHLDQSPDRTGQAITQRIARDGTVSEDAGLASQGVTAGYYDDITGHNVANVFWDFMNAQGLVYENGQFIQDQLFVNPFYATGRPITEPYFADVQVAGAVQTVLMQCFERRCMTFTPTNNTGFQVEAGNVGLHYFCWRYGYLPEGKGECIGSPVTPVPGDNGGDNGGGNATSTPGGGDNGGPTATPDDTDPTATPPTGDAPGVDVDLNLGSIQLSVLGGGYNVPVSVTNTGTQTDVIEVTLTKDAAITLCGPDSQTESITLNGGQSTILNFSQSCGVLSLDLIVDYTATATIARSPGASDTDSDDLLLVLDIGGGEEPTATSPSGNAPGVDVALNLGSIELSVLGGSYNVPVRVTNTGSQTDTIQVSLSRSGLLSTCSLIDSSKSVTLAGGASTTVNFQESCGLLAGVQLLVTYTAQGTIARSPGASDTANDQLILNLVVLPGDGDDDPPPPTGNDPGVNVDLNLSAITVDVSLLGGSDPFVVPVDVTNTGSQSDSIRVTLSGSQALGTCSPASDTKTISLAGGASTTVNFTQSCSGLLNIVGLQLLVNYTATGTIDRAPGASDTASDTQLLNLNLLGGGGGDDGGDNPPPGGSGTVEITNIPNSALVSIDGILDLSADVSIPVTIKNNGSSTASGTVDLDYTGLITLCNLEGTRSFSNLQPGSSTTVTFSRSCLIVVGVGSQYTATVRVGGNVTDSESFSVLIDLSVLSAPIEGITREAA